jgi:putative flippase GtrA
VNPPNERELNSHDLPSWTRLRVLSVVGSALILLGICLGGLYHTAVPAVFRLTPLIIGAIACVVSIVKFENKTFRQFVKFSLVGSLGLLINFLVTMIAARMLHAAPFLAFACGFMSGAISNYLLNRMWTFGSSRNAIVEGAQFLTVSGIALAVSKLVFLSFDHAGSHDFTLTWLLATLFGVVINFTINKAWTFRQQ